MKFVKAMVRESVYLIFDVIYVICVIYRLVERFIEWYYEWIDRK